MSVCFSFSAVYAQFGKLKEKAGELTKEKTKVEKPNKNDMSKDMSETETKSDADIDKFFSEKYNLLDGIITDFRAYAPDLNAVQEKITRLNYADARDKIKQKGKSALGKMNQLQYDNFVNFGTSGALRSGDINRGVRLDAELLKTGSNFYNEAAQKQKASQAAQAQKSLKEAQRYVGMIRSLFPENEEAKTLEKNIETLKTQIGASEGDFEKAVFTGEVHKKNVGKILFSKKPITPGKENEADFTTSFAANDNIYAIAYLDGTIEDLGKLADANSLNTNANYSMHIDGKQQNILFNFTPEARSQTYYLIEIIPDPKAALSITDAVEWNKKLAPLSAQKHKLKLWFWAAKTQLAESQEITIDRTGANLPALETNAKAAVASATDNYANIRSLPQKFSKPVEQFKDPMLKHANLIKLFMQKEKTCSEVIRVQTDVFEAYNSGADWEIKKNDIGIPIAKVTNGSVGILYKGKDGACYFVERLYYFQNYVGSNSYSPLELGNDYTKPQKIACSKLK
jgi:hypothetical protein